MDKSAKIIHLPESLKEFTAARIAIGRAGNSIPLNQSLQFKLAHAHARDAVHSVLDIDALSMGLKKLEVPPIHLHSEAENRYQYLQRPDLGRQLNVASRQQIELYSGSYDISILIADGLSALAVNTHAILVLEALLPLLISVGYKIAPVCMVEQARVAIGDEISAGLNAKLSVILIGERPGLSAADSMSAYLTYNPKPRLTDESRNCVSNIRPDGLPVKQAAQKIFYLVQESFKRRLSGVELKDNAGLLGA